MNRSAGALAGHFTGQLEASGWRATKRQLGERAAVAVLERRDRKQTYDAQSVFRPEDLNNTVKFEAARRAK